MDEAGVRDRRERQAMMRERTMLFALRVVTATRSLRACETGRVVADQLLRSGTAVAANYRAACRARSKKEFIARIGVVLEEADESLFWLELATRTELVPEGTLHAVAQEADELVAIFVATRCTARMRLAKP